MEDCYKYQGFMSYAHTDERVAARLHRALETFKIPKAVRAYRGQRLSPIFRDNSELTAHHNLSEKIQQGVEESRFLIVLCSPASRNSHWVNEEIRLFCESHDKGSILCALIEGTPSTSFPLALLEDGQEPIAANLTPQSFRLGVTQLAASMLGVGLDDLVQREMKRYRRRVTSVTAGALSAMLIMGLLTWTAISSRNLAEQRRADAEKMIEFMITGLKDELEVVGRLEPMVAVGQLASSYYDGYPLPDHDDDALGRRSRVFHFMGDTHDKLGQLNKSDRYYEKAFNATEALLARNPNDPERVFEHAQSVWGKGNRQRQLQDYLAAKLYFQTYLDMAKRLKQLEGKGAVRPQQELSYAYTNMGAIEEDLGNIPAAKVYYEKAITYKKLLFENAPDDKKRLISLAKAYANIGAIDLKEDNLESAIENWVKADSYIDTYNEKRGQTDDATLLYREITHARSLGRLYLLTHELTLAKFYSAKGKKAGEAFDLIEQGNIHVKNEIILLDILDFEIAYIKGDFEQARFISEKISRNIASFPEASRIGRRFKALKSIELNFPIYNAIADRQISRLPELAVERKKILKSEGLNTVQDLVDSSHNLSAVLMVNLILNDPYSEKLLADYCNDESISLGLNRKVQLAAKYTQQECPNLKTDNPIHPNIVSVSAKELAIILNE